MLPVLHKHLAMIKQNSEKGHSIIARMKNLSQGMNDTK